MTASNFFYSVEQLHQFGTVLLQFVFSVAVIVLHIGLDSLLGVPVPIPPVNNACKKYTEITLEFVVDFISDN